MKLGDRLRCAFCGRVSEPLHDRGGRAISEGGALIADWEGGHTAPKDGFAIACFWCERRIDEQRAYCERPQVTEGSVERDAAGEPSRLLLRTKTEGELALERFELLARDFHAETGLFAPGKDRSAAAGGDGVSEEERMRRWTAWLQERNAKATPKRPPAQPKGQMGLLL